MRVWVIYSIGLFTLGLAYQFLKQNLSGIVFLILAVAYAALLRWLAMRYGKK
jgi:hypothetical protein